MKLSTLSALLLAFGHQVLAADPGTFPICKPPPVSCKQLGYQAQKSCSSIISKSKIPITTCRKAQQTVVQTRTTQPTVTTKKSIKATTVTKTVTTTSTTRNAPVTLAPTIIATVTTTTTTQTSTSTTVSVSTTTTTTRQTQTISTTSTVVEKPTTTVPWSFPQCTVLEERELKELNLARVPADLFKNHRRAPAFPSECSCFLTNTYLNVKPTTTTSVLTKSITTTTTTIIGGSVPTKTATLTISKYTTIKGTTLVRATSYTTSTRTATQTITQTSVSTSIETTIEIRSRTTTSTSITTTTEPLATESVDPCRYEHQGMLYLQGQVVNTNNLAVLDQTGGWSRMQCCNQCFNRPDCVAWSWDEWNWCNNYYTRDIIPAPSKRRSKRVPDMAQCPSIQCPKGFPQLTVQLDEPGAWWGAGPCAAALIVQGSN